jgi:hypothetical protein
MPAITKNAKIVTILVLLTIAYVVYYGKIIYDGKGYPYVLDNNESISMIFHAQNLYKYGLSKSFGLTDESYSPDANGHPYVYTHAGNFPRFCSLLLYSLGATSVSSQIVITTFTVGLLGFLVCAIFFYLIGGTTFSIACTCLMFFDYFLFAQYYINLYHVFKVVFLFGPLVILHHYKKINNLFLNIITLIFSFCTFYFEIQFAIFASISILTYSFFISSRTNKFFQFYVCYLAGAFLSIGILIIQLIFFYGVDGLEKDVYLTFFSRNYANLINTEQVESFYSSKNIVFWANYFDGKISILNHIKSYVQYFLVHYSAYFSTVFLMLFFVVFLKNSIFEIISMPRVNKHFENFSHRFFQGGIKKQCLWVAIALLVMLSAGKLFFNKSDVMFLGGSIGGSNWPLVFSIWEVATCLFILAYLKNIRQTRPADLLCNMLSMLLSLVLLELLTNYLLDFYDIKNMILWSRQFIHFSTPILVIMLFFSVVVMLDMINNKDMHFEDQGNILYFLFSCAFSYLVLYYCIPGYVYTVSLKRFVPLIELFFPVIFAYIFSILAKRSFLSLKILASIGHEWRKKNYIEVCLSLIYPILTTSLLLYFCAGNYMYYKYFSPDGSGCYFSFASHVNIGSSSIVSDNYAAPFAYASKGWSYLYAEDLGKLFASGKIDNIGDYLWVADKASNDSYSRPDYYICFHNRSLQSLNDLIDLSNNKSINNKYCRRFVDLIISNNLGDKVEIIDYDKSPLMMWAIFKNKITSN